MNLTSKQRKVALGILMLIAISLIVFDIIAKPYIDEYNAKDRIVKEFAEEIAQEKARIPFKINSTLNLINIEQDRLHITYIYQALYKTADEINTHTPEEYYTPAQQADNCQYYKGYVLLGLVIDYVYLDKNGKWVFTKSVDKASCKL
ncbi:hypothetical protein [Acinetobacter oleivorans]|jgi:hypothetical protein|uniref:hypothetical protein n=1 Tax=Acinetobacter oleivorans TaxID=1148157 RepID=UPI00124F7951|nr:hypothetical protein [Acinetobacter oleivorans]